MKIGYLSTHFCGHSIGYLIRWIAVNHSPNVELYLYQVGEKNDPLGQWFRSIKRNDRSVLKVLPSDENQIAEAIRRDDLDLLIELESITSDVTGKVMLLHQLQPIARATASYLGWEGMGLADYFIGDELVTPDSGRYAERLINLPRCYTGCQGWEVAPPQFSRKDLEIPEGAIVFWSGYKNIKRTTEHTILQMQIVEQSGGYLILKTYGVPNSSDREALHKLAGSVGLRWDRVRLIGDWAIDSEPSFRGTMQAIADIALDSFPYNCTTTTLEQLWLGIPVVSRYGESFSSRQGLTLLSAVGLPELAVATDKEYLEAALECARDLREYRAKLADSRRSSVLWDVRDLVKELEGVYQEIIELKNY